MTKAKKPKQSQRVREEKAEIERRRNRLIARLADVNAQLVSLGTERKGEMPSHSRLRESRRKQRMALLLSLEKLDRAAERIPRFRYATGRTVVQGPRSGITRVVSGGSPGLGRRS
jgi:hypothetical protein